MKTRPVFLLTALACLLSVLPALAAEKVLFEDTFQGKLGPGWTWLRENPEAWKLADNALLIRVEPGLAPTVRNALVRPAPDRTRGKLAIDVTVAFQSDPSNQYEQAGITWYREGKPVFKLVHELIDGKLCIVPGKKPTQSKTIQLRLVLEGENYTAQYREQAKGEFLTAASGKLPIGKDEQVSIQCYNGPRNEEHWIRFDDFRITQLD